MKLQIFVNDQNIIQAQLISDDGHDKLIILPKDIEVSNVKLWSKGIFNQQVKIPTESVYLHSITTKEDLENFAKLIGFKEGEQNYIATINSETKHGDTSQ